MSANLRTVAQLEALRISDLKVLEVAVREAAPYRIDRQWGNFDELGVRAVDDLWFPEEAAERVVAFVSAELAEGADVEAVSIPAAIALERAFFHIQEVTAVAINPASEPGGLSELQAGAVAAVQRSGGPEVMLRRGELPAVLGMLAVGRKRIADPLARAQRAFRDGSLFESYFLARRCRESGRGDAGHAWFIELMSLSFLGLPEEAILAYEEYPERGSASPQALLLAARFRLLLKQMNEARTILHTLTFNDAVGAFAACELARSYAASGDFSRAIDTAGQAILKDPSYAEPYLVRGIAHRGIAYPSGEEEGLREALANFEAVARRGGFAAAEASFHAATVFGRLGALDAAETSLRQSLFQRDRFSSRDALVRVLCAAEKGLDAQDELSLVLKLAPTMGRKLADDVGTHLSAGGRPPADGDVGVVADLWSADFAVACHAAAKVVESWKLPVRRGLDDFVILDDFINRFAPAGDFPGTGEWASLGACDSATLSRVFSLYLGSLLVELGLGSWTGINPEHLVIELKSAGTRLPIEAFVKERIVLGASGDNFSSLESLVADARTGDDLLRPVALPNWWRAATTEEAEEFAKHAEACRKRLAEMGAGLKGGLGDLEEVDRIIDAYFEPGGEVKAGMEATVGESVEAFVLEAGLLVGSIVAQALGASWHSHEQPEGISLFHPVLGRVFPVSKVQRRVYLASAADFGAKLGSFAFGVAAVAAQEGIRAGRLSGVEQVRDFLVATLPSMRSFPEAELQGVAQSLLGARL